MYPPHFVGTKESAVMHFYVHYMSPWSREGLSVYRIDQAMSIIEGLRAALPQGDRIETVTQILTMFREFIVTMADHEEREREQLCKHSGTVSIDEELFGSRWNRRCVACNAIKNASSGEWYNDRTGLCTVREFAEELVRGDMKACPSDSGFVPATPERMLSSPAWPWSEMAFTHNGKRFNVEMVVTKCEDVK